MLYTALIYMVQVLMRISPRPLIAATRAKRCVAPSMAVMGYAAHDAVARRDDAWPTVPARPRHDAGYVTQWLDQHLGSVGRHLPQAAGYNAYGAANQNTQPGPKIARISA